MPTRNYKYSDDELIQYANNLLGYLEDDLPDFEAFDADLGTPKKEALSTLVIWGLEEGGDELNVAKLGDFTQRLLEEMATARKLYNQLRYWVVKTFPNRKAVQRQFGIGRFRKVAASQAGLISFFSSLKDSIADYRVQLEAAKTPPDLLDQIALQGQALSRAQQDQEKKKGSRTVDTEERVKKLNELFDLTRAYNAAAEFVYFDLPAKRDLYRPPASPDPTDEDDAED
ncbi:MAG: hypothetical protein AAGA66_03905 [Bacteroidota bacterium]